MHPSIHVTAEQVPGLRSVEDLCEHVRSGFGRPIWERMVAWLEWASGCPPFHLKSTLPGRPAKMVELGSFDYQLLTHVVQRILCGALAHLITGTTSHRDDALKQIEVLLDDTQWPDWRSEINAQLGKTADLRLGDLTYHLALAYDWLWPSLREDQRRWMREGIERRGIRQILASRKRDPFWSSYNNWTAEVVSAMGLAGMVFGDEHPRSAEMVADALAWMREWVDALGPDGDSTESVAYSGAIVRALEFFRAYRYATGGRVQVLEGTRLDRYGRWYTSQMLPPGRAVAFGDTGGGECTPHAVLLGMLADLTRDRVLQWFYLRYREASMYQDYPMELLGVDPSIEPEDPEGRWPRGTAFRGHGQHVVSRTDWNPRTTACIVCGKGAHGWEEMRVRGDTGSYHLDYDAGQVTIDGHGRHLIVDLGSSGGYTVSGLPRGGYYGKGTTGHNVPMVDGKTTRDLGIPRPGITDSAFDDEKGGWWRVDLTGLYEGARRVLRTVVHLHPGIVAVLDEIDLEGRHEISLRWHTVDACTPDPDGSFTVTSADVRCACRVARIGGEAPSFRRGEHRYEAPYDVGYHGLKLVDGESYVEACLEDSSATLLSLFCVGEPGGDARRWVCGDGTWSIALPSGTAEVRVGEDALGVGVGETHTTWRVGRG